LLALDPRWAEPGYWQAIEKNGSRWTPDYLLTSVDLKRDIHGDVVQSGPDEAAFVQASCCVPSASAPVVTIFCLLLGYPLAYWLSTLTPRASQYADDSGAGAVLDLDSGARRRPGSCCCNPTGWSTARCWSWASHREPLPLLFNRLGVVIAMVHILLPFMILPLYSVMKSVPPTYLRAAVSLGSPPLAAFFRVYVPQTWPGIGAGGLLVFIT
jgi:putative spermidine/putrescine transport system permease protein